MSIQTLRLSINLLRDPTYPLTERKKATNTIFKTILMMPPEELHILSCSEKEALSQLYGDIAHLPASTDPLLVKVGHLFQTHILPSYNTSYDDLTQNPLSIEKELFSWKQSPDSSERKAHSRIKEALAQLKAQEKAGYNSTPITLNLANLSLKRLPSFLFTEPRFANVNIVISNNEFSFLPNSLTIDSLTNIKLYEQFMAEVDGLPALAATGEHGQLHALTEISSFLNFEDLTYLSETSRNFVHSLSFSAKLVIDTEEKFSAFLRAIQTSPYVWRNLNSLSLANCPLLDENLALIVKKCPSIQYLHLSSCFNVTDDSLAYIASLKSLKKLILERIGCLSANGLLHLQFLHLQELSLSGCRQLASPELGVLSQLPHLLDLDLSGCLRVTNEDLQALTRLTQLRSLDLSGCRKITDTGLQLLAALAHLDRLGVSGCEEVTTEGVLELRNALPQLQVTHQA